MGRRSSHIKEKSLQLLPLEHRPLYDFIHENPAVEFLPVSVVNDP